MSGKHTILSLFERSWGEVDWILPVLFELKKLKPDWQLIIIFSEEWRRYNPIQPGRTSYAEINDVADNIVWYEKSGTSIPGVNAQEQVKIILKDSGADVPFKHAIQNAFPFAKIVAHPHGTADVISQRYNHPRNFNEWEKTDNKHDLYLIERQTKATHLYRLRTNAKFGVVGFPCYDRWWIEKLMRSQELSNSAEANMAASHQRVFLFNSKGISRATPEVVYDYINQSVASSILNNNRNCLLIKPHPRENISLLKSYFKRFDSQRWMISNLHVIQLASLADFVISVSSSVTNDILSVRKPVVEFARFIQPYSGHEVDPEGRFTSVSRLQGLVVPADTREELVAHIDHYFNTNSDVGIWDRQRKAFSNICPPLDNASNRAARLILSLVEQDFVRDDLPFIQSAGTPITGEKQIFLEKKETGQSILNLQLKRIQACGMPISSILLKELAQIFKRDIFVMTGTFNEHLTSEAAKIFREVHSAELASDLYQASAMKEISSFSNIRIYHSANFLKEIVRNLEGGVLFWLSTHESAFITTKSRTNISVIEELRTIGESHLKDAVILINNIRYFQPIAVQEHEAQKNRKYPSIQEALNVIQTINPAYQFIVLGDIAIAYLPEYPVIVSPAVQACTFSRLFDNTMLHINNEVVESEKLIAYGLSVSEKKVIQTLHKDFFSYEEPRIGGYYRFWNGLTFFGENRYDEAKNEFFEACKLGCNHWRVLWMLALSANTAGDHLLAKESLQVILKMAPAFEPAQKLLKQINANNVEL